MKKYNGDDGVGGSGDKLHADGGVSGTSSQHFPCKSTQCTHIRHKANYCYYYYGPFRVSQCVRRWHYRRWFCCLSVESTEDVIRNARHQTKLSKYNFRLCHSTCSEQCIITRSVSKYQLLFSLHFNTQSQRRTVQCTRIFDVVPFTPFTRHSLALFYSAIKFVLLLFVWGVVSVSTTFSVFKSINIIIAVHTIDDHVHQLFIFIYLFPAMNTV